MLSKIGRYEVIQFLGEGGAGQVYQALDPSVQRQVAIKLLTANSADQRARFDREAQLLAKLDHQNIVPIYDFGEQEGHPYIVMRFMPGGTLHNLIYGRRLSYQEIVAIIGKVANALDFAHNLGIVHRDIKPANILFNERNEPQIGDFGLSKIFTIDGSGGPTQDKIIGTPHYMSPEQIKGGHLDHLTDIYSLGVVLFEICNGRVPFEAEDALGILFKHTHEPVPSMPHLPDSIATVITTALAKEPEQRYPSAGHLHQALANAVDELTTPQTGPQKAGQTTSKTTITLERSHMIYGGIGIAALGVIGLLMFGGGNRSGTPTPTPSQPGIAIIETEEVEELISSQTVVPEPTSTQNQNPTSPNPTSVIEVDSNGRFLITRDQAAIYTGPALDGYEPFEIPARSGDRYNLIAFNADRTWVLIELSTGRKGWMVANAGEIEGIAPGEIAIAQTEPAPEIVSPATLPPTLTPIVEAPPTPIGGGDGWIVHLEGLVRNADIVLSNLITGERRVVTNDSVEDYGATWAPDGQQIVFATQNNSTSFSISTFDLRNGLTQTIFENSRGAGYPSWSPDGNRIAFHAVNSSNRFQIYVMNRDGSNLVQLTNSDTSALQPNWSPSGQEIAYVETESNRRQLMIMSASGGNQRRLTFDLSNSYSNPTWSPDGTRLAFHFKDDTSATTGIHLIDTDGQNLRRLTNGVDFYPSWSPDSNWILFHRRIGEDRILYRVRPDGTELTEVWDAPLPLLEAEWRSGN